MPGSADLASASSEIFWLRINIARGFYVEMRACQPMNGRMRILRMRVAFNQRLNLHLLLPHSGRLQ